MSELPTQTEMGAESGSIILSDLIRIYSVLSPFSFRLLQSIHIFQKCNSAYLGQRCPNGLDDIDQEVKCRQQQTDWRLSDVSYLIIRCFEPSQPQRITSGLNTNFTLSPSYSFDKSSYHKSCSWAYLNSAGTQHENLHPAGWPILLYGLTQEPCVSHSQHRKNRERFWNKNAGERTGSAEISKEEIPGSKPSMYGYILTYSRL